MGQLPLLSRTLIVLTLILRNCKIPHLRDCLITLEAHIAGFSNNQNKWDKEDPSVDDEDLSYEYITLLRGEADWAG